MTSRRADSERGFTFVEVLIAVLLLMTIASGVTLAFASGTRVEQTRDVTTRLSATAERVYEHLRGDKDWVEDCRRARPTSSPRSCAPFEGLSSGDRTRLATDPVLGVAFQVTSSAEGIDNAGDGTGANDRDGNVDDFFKITITVDIQSRDRGRLGRAKPLTVSSILSGADTDESGSLIVSFCGAANQVDERIVIGSCPQRYTWFDMPDCAGEPGCSPRSIFPGTPPANPLAASRMVAVEPLRPSAGSLRITKRDAPHAGRVIDGSAAVWDPTLQSYKFADLPTGTYEVSGYTIGGWIPWTTHHIPSALNDRPQVTVERHRTAAALIALKRPGASGAFRMRFDREVNEEWYAQRSRAFPTGWIPECEQPASFNRDAFGTTSVTCNEPRMTVTWYGGGSATACLEGLCNDVTQYRSDGHFQETVTVDYIDRSRGAEYVWNGAADSATFSTQPEPAGRYTIRTRTAGGRASYTIPTGQWTKSIARAPRTGDAAANTTADGVGTGSISGVPLGLNDGIEQRTSSGIGNVFQRYSPAGCDPRYLWVSGSSFTSGSCSSLHFRGKGECYQNLAGGWTGQRYTRRLGCGGLYWPPVNRRITRPGYLIVRMCVKRESRLTWSETKVYGWDASGVFGSATSEEFKAFHRERGGTIYEEGETTLGPRTVRGLRAVYNSNGSRGPTLVYSQCRSTPTVSSPMVCPALDDWSNCDRVYRIEIPATRAIHSRGGLTDGQRPNNQGSSIRALSG